MQHGAWERVPIDAQSVEAPLSRSAVFLVMAAGGRDADLARLREVLGAVGDLVKNVGFRDLGGRLSCVVGIGSALWDRLSPAQRPVELRPFAPIQGSGARGAVDARRSALPPARRARGHDLRARTPAAGPHRGRRAGHRRHDRLSLLRRARPAGLRRRHGQPDRSGAARRGVDRDRCRPRVRGRQLRRGPEVPARHGRLGRALDRRAGGDHGPDQDRQHRDRRRLRAAQVPQIAGDDRGRCRGRAGDPPRQHALRATRRRRVRHLLHRLLRPAVGHRADARAHVHRRAARRLRPAAGLLDRDHRDDVLRAHRGDAGGTGRTAVGPGRRDGAGLRGHCAGRRGAAVPGHRVAARDGLGPDPGGLQPVDAVIAREVIPLPGPPRCACRAVARTSRCASRRARRAG